MTTRMRDGDGAVHAYLNEIEMRNMEFEKSRAAVAVATQAEEPIDEPTAVVRIKPQRAVLRRLTAIEEAVESRGDGATPPLRLLDFSSFFLGDEGFSALFYALTKTFPKAACDTVRCPVLDVSSVGLRHRGVHALCDFLLHCGLAERLERLILDDNPFLALSAGIALLETAPRWPCVGNRTLKGVSLERTNVPKVYEQRLLRSVVQG